MICTIVSDGTEFIPYCKNENNETYSEIKKRLRKAVTELIINGYDTFYVNCEYGVPFWAAEIICDLKLYNKITLNIVMPYEEQASGWSDEISERFFKIHAEADRVFMVNPRYYDGVYETADKIMICQSDLLAVFGSKNAEIHAVNCAEKSGAAIKYI